MKFKNGKETVINRICIVKNEIANKYVKENPTIIDFQNEHSIIKKQRCKEFSIDFFINLNIIFILSFLLFSVINFFIITPMTYTFLISLINGIWISFVLSKIH